MGIDNLDRTNDQVNFSLAEGRLQDSTQYQIFADDSQDADKILDEIDGIDTQGQPYSYEWGGIRIDVGSESHLLETNISSAQLLTINSRRVGELHTFSNNADFMQIHPSRSPALFDTHGTDSFPNLGKIETNLKDTDSRRTLGLAMPLNMYEPGGELTGFAMDNGNVIGQVSSKNAADILQDSRFRGKGVVVITGRKIIITHASELTASDLQIYIDKNADIATLPSVKRNGNLNTSQSLWSNDSGYFLVQYNDGTQGYITLNWLNPEEKKAIIMNPNISRAVYCDVVGDKGQLNQYGQGSGGNPIERHNINTQNPIDGSPIHGNYPSVLIGYSN